MNVNVRNVKVDINMKNNFKNKKIIRNNNFFFFIRSLKKDLIFYIYINYLSPNHESASTRL